MKLLIVYGTTEGQTQKIAHQMQVYLREDGHKVDVCDASNLPIAPDGYDGVMIGASIHMGKYQTSITHYVTHHADQLNRIPSAFFSVCLAVASDIQDEHKEAERITQKFLEHTGWTPSVTTQIAGALKYSQYDFFKRILMKMIARREGHATDTSVDYEYTDWAAVRTFAEAFAGHAAQQKEQTEKKSSVMGQ